MFAQPSSTSLYVGRTRGKRIRYNFSDADDDKDSEFDAGARSGRSTRNTPLPEAPRFTASGRQIRKPQTGIYGEIKINGSRGTSAGSESEAQFSYAEDQWDGDSQGDDEDEGDADPGIESESEWDDTAFLQHGEERRSLKIILKVNKDRPSRANSVVREITNDGKLEDTVNGNKRRRIDSNITIKDVETLANGHGPPVSSVVAG